MSESGSTSKPHEAAWVDTVAYEDAQEPLREIYDEVRGRRELPHNLYRAHSLRPQTIQASDQLYKSVLHCSDNTLPLWIAELASTYTAMLLKCDYAAVNHGANFCVLYGDHGQGEAILQTLREEKTPSSLDGKVLALLDYCKQLTLSPQSLVENDIQRLRDAGLDDAEIVEINQVCASFNYFARVLNGLGVKLDDVAPGFYTQPHTPIPT